MDSLLSEFILRQWSVLVAWTEVVELDCVAGGGGLGGGGVSDQS